jgi:hypothetical protein
VLAISCAGSVGARVDELYGCRVAARRLSV